MRPRCTAAPPPAAQDPPLSPPLERRRLAQKQVQHMGAQSRLALDFTIKVFKKPESNAPQRHRPLPGIDRCRRRWSAAAWLKNKCGLMMSNLSLLCHARPKITAERGSSGRICNHAIASLVPKPATPQAPAGSGRRDFAQCSSVFARCEGRSMVLQAVGAPAALASAVAGGASSGRRKILGKNSLISALSARRNLTSSV